MTSQTAPRTLVPLILTGLLVAGCGSGRQAQVYVPETKPPVESAVAQAAAPVVPVVSKPAEKAPTVIGQGAQAATDTGAAEREAEAKKELREERGRARRARKRAAAREAALRTWLAQARAESREKQAAAEKRQQTVRPSGDGSPIGASDVKSEVSQAELNRRSDAEARAATLRFHELLDNHDARACGLLTPRLLRAYYGEDDALARCRASVEAITAHVSVTIVRSHAQDGRAVQEVVSRIGDSEQAQILRLVLVSGTWLLDAVDHKTAT